MRNRSDKLFTAWFIFYAMVATVWIGVLIWAVITLVNWVSRHA